MRVAAVHAREHHSLGKDTREHVRLLAGLGVEGDAHLGERVQHRSRKRADPTQPNLRQVHLVHAELHDELRAAGFVVAPGQLGENVTTRGIDLLGLGTGTLLTFADNAVVEITGLRNPCTQLDGLQAGLMAATLDRDADGALVRKAGVMGVVLVGGEVRAGDRIAVRAARGPHRPLVAV